MTLRTHADSGTYDHSALLYETEREYVDWLTRFVAEGLDRLHPVLIAVPGEKLACLRDELGDAAADVAMSDITEFGRNPGRILATQLAFVERHPEQHVRIIAEPVWAGRTAHEHLACMQHEALANIAFANTDMTSLCPYDASCLDDSVLAHVRLTHPGLWMGGSRQHNPEYAIETALDQCNQPLTTNPAAVSHTVHVAADLAGARRCGERYGRLLGMSADQVADLLLVATELATTRAARADWPSGTRPGTLSAKPATGGTGEIRWRDVDRPPHAASVPTDCSWSMRSQTCYAPIRRQPAPRSMRTCGSTIPPKPPVDRPTYCVLVGAASNLGRND